MVHHFNEHSPLGPSEVIHFNNETTHPSFSQADCPNSRASSWLSSDVKKAQGSLPSLAAPLPVPSCTGPWAENCEFLRKTLGFHGVELKHLKLIRHDQNRWPHALPQKDPDDHVEKSMIGCFILVDRNLWLQNQLKTCQSTLQNPQPRRLRRLQTMSSFFFRSNSASRSASYLEWLRKLLAANGKITSYVKYWRLWLVVIPWIMGLPICKLYINIYDTWWVCKSLWISVGDSNPNGSIHPSENG